MKDFRMNVIVPVHVTAKDEKQARAAIARLFLKRLEFYGDEGEGAVILEGDYEITDDWEEVEEG